MRKPLSSNYRAAFDAKLETMQRSSNGSVEHQWTLDAAAYVHDTLELAFAAARSLDAKATLADAFSIYDRIELERLRKLSEG